MAQPISDSYEKGPMAPQFSTVSLLSLLVPTPSGVRNTRALSSISLAPSPMNTSKVIHPTKCSEGGHVKSRDSTTYLFFREFHEGNGFDATSEDVGKHLGLAPVSLSVAPFEIVQLQNIEESLSEEFETRSSVEGEASEMLPRGLKFVLSLQYGLIVAAESLAHFLLLPRVLSIGTVYLTFCRSYSLDRVPSRKVPSCRRTKLLTACVMARMNSVAGPETGNMKNLGYDSIYNWPASGEAKAPTIEGVLKSQSAENMLNTVLN
ncbi:hypothetical protein B0H11DRAFT_1925633 [Mycena galericulata]|nr:hypothetical protein B0H11DRAFT_1925633 [Mycena galericulata]